MQQTTRQHARIGGSTCERAWNCPGSVNAVEAEEQVSPVRANKYMSEGTVAHAVAESLLSGIIRGESKAMYEPIVGSYRYSDGNRIEITREMINHGYAYSEVIFGIAKRYGIQWKDISIEKGVSINSELYGTADVEMHSRSRLIVVDYKYGAGTPVHAHENKQLMYYALGAYLNLPEEATAELDNIETHIFQPRCPGAGHTVYEIPTGELMEFRAELLERVEATKAPDAPMKAGMWCGKTFCPVRAKCVAYKALVEEESQIDLEEFTKAYQKDTAAAMLQSHLNAAKVNWTPAQVSNMVQTGIPLLEDFVKAFKSYAHGRALSGAVPGMKVVQDYGNRAWTNKRAIIDTLGPLGVEIYSAPELKTPRQVEIAIAKYNRENKGAEKLTTEIVKENCKKPATKQSLVPDSDSRQAVIANDAEADFKDIDYGSLI